MPLLSCTAELYGANLRRSFRKTGRLVIDRISYHEQTEISVFS